LMTGQVSVQREKTRPDIVRSIQDLASIGQPAIEYLTLALREEDKRVRIEAIKALGGIADPCCCGHLAAQLRDGDRDIRLAAVVALGKVGDVKACNSLFQASTDENCFVRVAAREALARILKKESGADVSCVARPDSL
jgi:HEAT repeat protein